MIKQGEKRNEVIMLEKSRYNHTTVDPTDNSFLLYNSLSGAIFRLSEKAVKEYEKVMHNKIAEMDRDIFDTFKKHNVLVPPDLNKDEYIDYLRAEHVEANETLDIMILVTEQCNLRCRYCYENFEKGNITEDCETGIIEFIKKNIKKYKKCIIKWFGGEPLLNVEAIERMMKKIIELCNQNAVILQTSITTNAIMLDSKIVNRLLKSKIYEYQVTLDGLKEIHDSQRVTKNGKGTYDIVLRNLLDIKNNVNNRLIAILVRTNFTIDSIDTIEDFAKLYSELFGEDKRFSVFWTPAMDWGGEAVKNISKKLVESFSKAFVNQYAAKYNIPLVMERSFLYPGGKVCYASKRHSYIIGSDGQIYKCSQRLYDDYNIIGKINPKGELNIDKTKEFSWVAASLRLSDRCRNCIMNPCCLSGRCPKRYIAEVDCDFTIEELNKSIFNFNRINSGIIDL